VRIRGQINKQFSCVSSREQQGERHWCLFQPLDDVELANYTTLRGPLAEISKSLRIAISIIKTTRDGALSSGLEEEVVFLHNKAFHLRALRNEI
jgi:hypothetical protein